MFLSDPSCNTD